MPLRAPAKGKRQRNNCSQPETNGRSYETLNDADNEPINQHPLAEVVLTNAHSHGWLDEDSSLSECRETKDLDEDGNVCAITVEHARERTRIPSFSYEFVTA
jgi:hypothetical protein